MRLTRVLAAWVATLLLLAFPAVASAAIKVSKIHYDPPGEDTGTNVHLNKEYVVLKNTGAGW